MLLCMMRSTLPGLISRCTRSDACSVRSSVPTCTKYPCHSTLPGLVSRCTLSDACSVRRSVLTCALASEL